MSKKTRCTICLDLRVPEINRSLLMVSAAKTAKKFGFSTAATLGRHRRECLKLVASEIKQQRTELRTQIVSQGVVYELTRSVR